MHLISSNRRPTRRRRVLFAVALAVAAATASACGLDFGAGNDFPFDGSVSEAAPPRDREPPQGTDAAEVETGADANDAAAQPDTTAVGPPRCPATVLSTPLVAVVSALRATMRVSAGSGSMAYVEPSTAARDAFARTVVAAIGGDEMRACALPPSYRVVELDDPTYGRVRLAAELDARGVPAPVLHYGAYARRVDFTATRALVVEAPHPLHDAATDDQAQDLFVRSFARYLLVAGSHRCASAAESMCSGTTTSCGARAPFRVSDPAHSTSHPFFAVHGEILKDPTLVTVQLHGNAAACPQALLSDASQVWPTSGFVPTFANALEAEGITVGRCGDGYPVAGCDLCGGTNVEGRFSAGSGDACTLPGPNGGRFLHLEQLIDLRRREAGAPTWGPVLRALEASLPRE